ncbi:Arf GTPase arl1 [Paramecium bursaria]
MQGAMSESDIAEYLQLSDIKNRPWAIVKCSAFTGLGLQEGMEWIANAIKK